MTKITIETEGKEPVVLEGDIFIVSVGKETEDGLIYPVMSANGSYFSLTRMHLSQAVGISNHFNEQVKAKGEEGGE